MQDIKMCHEQIKYKINNSSKIVVVHIDLWTHSCIIYIYQYHLSISIYLFLTNAELSQQYRHPELPACHRGAAAVATAPRKTTSMRKVLEEATRKVLVALLNGKNSGKIRLGKVFRGEKT